MRVKSRIKQITLLDGKQLFYPSAEEVAKLNDQIAEVIVEHTMSKKEFDDTHRELINAALFGVSFTKILLEPEDVYDALQHKNNNLK